jgi:solute carrier family 25 protein 33/36
MFSYDWEAGGFVRVVHGLTPHMARSIPSAVIALGVYEFVLRIIEP